ncbi:MAG: competence/damage-inducible protein A [Cyanobacteriota bacterium]|nr:competence/damage-inducible protein A [Cyanobacteriota bacterium]
MSAEILCIGTELLLGDILNGNARWLARELASLGVPHHRQAVVGDNKERLIAAVREAAGRCRVLITTGGLGPTEDDLTTASLAAAFDAPLVEHPEIWADIQAKLRGRGKPIPASNRRQALLPKGASVLPNAVGTAPGMIWSPLPGFTILTFPGVPSEMRAMWRATAEPWLRGAAIAEGVFLSRRLHVWGVGESRLAERVADLMERSNPTVAPYAGGGQVTLRLTAKATDADAARSLLEPTEREVRERIGAACFGADDETLASVVLTRLIACRQTLAVAESCTGGALGAALAAVPGASEAWLGGVMAYANAAKRDLLGVPAELLAQWGAVSDPVALAMARGVRQRLGSDWALAVTGIAGPGGGTEDKPVGTVHLAVVGPEPFAGWSEGVRFGPTRGRAAIQALSVGEALNRLRLSLMGLEPSSP